MINLAPALLLGAFRHAHLAPFHLFHLVQQPSSRAGGRSHVSRDRTSGSQRSGKNVEIHEDGGYGIATQGQERACEGFVGREHVGLEIEAGLADVDEAFEELSTGFDKGAVWEGIKGSTDRLDRRC